MLGGGSNVDNLTLEGMTLRRLTGRLIPLLFLMYVVSIIDRTNVSFAALHMNRDLGFSAAMYGLGAGIFFLGYALFEVPSNLVLVRVGARRWIARIAITWGLIASAMMFVRSAESFYVLRFLLGVAEAGFFPGIIYYLSHWFPERHRARAISRFMLGVPVAVVVSGPLSGAILALDGTLGIAGWQWLFLLEGIPAVMLGAVALRYLTDRPEDARWLPPDECAWLRVELEREHQGGVARVERRLMRAMTVPALWYLAVPYIVVGIASYAAIFWAPTLVRESLGLEPMQIGLVIGAIGVVSGLAMVWLGASSDHRNERVAHASVAMAVSASGFAIAALRPHPVIAVIGLAAALAGSIAFLPVFWCLPTRFLRGTAAAGGIALLNAVGSIGGFVGPGILGVVRDAMGTFSGGLAAVSAMTFGGAIVMWMLRRVSILSQELDFDGSPGNTVSSVARRRGRIGDRFTPAADHGLPDDAARLRGGDVRYRGYPLSRAEDTGAAGGRAGR